MYKKIKIHGIEVDPRDEKYILKTPEPGFSPERNKQVIEESIAKAELLRQRKWKDWEDQTRERANALASYFKFLDRGGNGTTGKYFGRKFQAYLRGEEFLERYKDIYIGRNANGQIIKSYSAE